MNQPAWIVARAEAKYSPGERFSCHSDWKRAHGGIGPGQDRGPLHEPLGGDLQVGLCGKLLGCEEEILKAEGRPGHAEIHPHLAAFIDGDADFFAEGKMRAQNDFHILRRKLAPEERRLQDKRGDHLPAVASTRGR